LPKRTACENIAFAMEVCGHRVEHIAREVPKILDLVGLSAKRNSFPNQMSGGEKQRVAIARALSHRPVLLLADEPTGNLDTKTGEIVLTTFKRLNKEEGRTIILITHEPDVAAHADRIIHVRDGDIVESLHAASGRSDILIKK
jgi:putative ABC transport system ATP-binding protein